MMGFPVVWKVCAVVCCVLGPSLAQEPKPVVPVPAFPGLPDDWAQRDLDSKWVYLQQDLKSNRADTKRLAKWVGALAAVGDADALAEIATWTQWSQGVGRALVALEDPRWMALAVWNLGAFSSHNKDIALKVVEGNRGLFLGWLKRFPTARVGIAATLADRFENEAVKPDDASELAPPLDSAQVLEPWLQKRGDWVEMLPKQHQAKAGVSYIHRTLRALSASRNTGRATPYVIARIVELAGDDNPDVRVMAHDVLAAMPAHLIPILPLLHRAHDQNLDAGLRRLAFLTASHSTHPRSYWELWSAFLGSDPVLAEVASARLGEIGRAAELAILEGASSQRPNWEEAKAALTGTIQSRVEQDRASGFQNVMAYATSTIERGVWIRVLSEESMPIRAATQGESDRLQEFMVDRASSGGAGFSKVVLDHVSGEFEKRPPSWLQGDAANDAQREFLKFVESLRGDG